MEMNNNLDFDMFENSDLVKSLLEEVTESEVADLGIDISDTRFSIANEGQANFFLRKLTEVRSEKDKINNICNKEIEDFTARVNNFRNKELQSLENTESYFATLLEDYARKELETMNKKTLKLPFGTMSLKKSPAKIVYDDEKLLTYVKNNNLEQFIRVKEEINKKDLKASLILNDDGTAFFNNEQVEGITVMPPEERFSIK